LSNRLRCAIIGAPKGVVISGVSRVYEKVTGQIALLLVIIGASLTLFSLERLPTDVLALGTMLALILTGLLPAERAFAGFGSDTVVMMFGLLVLAAALVRTGVVDTVGRAITRCTGSSGNRLPAVIMAAAAALSAVMSNTASTALFVPVTLGLARRTRLRASKLLMPLAFASILASSVTLVSSSTNLVISGLMTQYGMRAIGMFELTAVGIPIAVAGLTYMILVGRWLIPDRGDADVLTEEFGIRPYLTELLILPDSPLVGKTLAESGLGRDLDLTVLWVDGAKRRYFAPQANHKLRAGDVLLVKGQRNEVLKVKDAVGISIKGDVELSDPGLQTGDVRLVEVILMPGSSLIGRTLKGIHFRQRYGLQVLGIDRHGRALLSRVSEIALRSGDQLLVQGHQANIVALEEDQVFRVLSTVDYQRLNRERAPVAVAVFVGALALAAFDLLPLPVAVLLGVLVAFVSRCITPDEAYRVVEWRALILIGCMLAVGSAMEYTGTARFLAVQIVGVASQAHPVWLLTAFFALTMLLTQPLSNQAAAVVVVPIALQTAWRLGLNPRTFAMMIAVGASCSFLTPLEPACLMVYGPGRYRFVDFLKVGAPLTMLVYAIAIVLVPLIWPL